MIQLFLPSNPNIPTANPSCYIVGLLGAEIGLLEWVFDLIILPEPDLLLLLRNHMLRPNLLGFLFHECSYESWIPQLAGHAEIFAAAHQCIRFAAFSGSWYAFGGEIILFAACN